jgi:hypothetical protein
LAQWPRGRHGSLVSGLLRGAGPGAPHRVVALGGDEPVGAVGGDQGAVEQAVEHLLARAAFDVVREPVDLAAGVFEGVGQDRVLGRGQLVVVICCSFRGLMGDVMNALFGKAKRFLLGFDGS